MIKKKYTRNISKLRETYRILFYIKKNRSEIRIFLKIQRNHKKFEYFQNW